MSVSLQSEADDTLQNTGRATDQSCLQKAVSTLLKVEVIVSNMT